MTQTNTIFRISCGAECALKLIGRKNCGCVSCACLSMGGSHALFLSSRPLLEISRLQLYPSQHVTCRRKKQSVARVLQSVPSFYKPCSRILKLFPRFNKSCPRINKPYPQIHNPCARFRNPFPRVCKLYSWIDLRRTASSRVNESYCSLLLFYCILLCGIGLQQIVLSDSLSVVTGKQRFNKKDVRQNLV